VAASRKNWARLAGDVSTEARGKAQKARGKVQAAAGDTAARLKKSAR
jgi:uncharacterized protein YjbJ (UPF0337 family)